MSPRYDTAAVEQCPHPAEGTHLCGLNNIEKIVRRDKSETECQNRPFWQPHQTRQDHHTDTQRPDHSAECPGNERPGKFNNRPFENDQPDSTSQEEARNLPD